MFDLKERAASAQARAQGYAWVIQQSRCRACGNVHERELGIMREHAPGSWIRAACPQGTNEATLPVVFQEAQLAWCEGCHSSAAQELTRKLRELIDLYGNTTALAERAQAALLDYERAHNKEHFHHGAMNVPPAQTRPAH